MSELDPVSSSTPPRLGKIIVLKSACCRCISKIISLRMKLVGDLLSGMERRAR